MKKTTSESERKTIAVLKKFEALYPYLKLIARANARKPFDREVVEAYWLGNEFLENVGARDYAQLIARDFARPGLLPKKLALEISSALPSDALPSHNFHVLFFHLINARTLAMHFQPSLATVNECIVSWGRVRKKKPFVVERACLRVAGNKIVSTRASTQPKPLFLKARAGDAVALHRGYAVKVLGERERENLEHYAKKAVDAVSPLL